MRQRKIKRTSLSVSEIGFGAAGIGNLYQSVSDATAKGTIEAALASGIGYYDTAPHYGFGLSERRLGDVLRDLSGYTLSSKVGRLLRPVPSHRGSDLRSGFATPMPFQPEFDYSYKGVMRSFEDSLQRLGLARIDILYVHDIGAATHRHGHAARMTELIDGGGLQALAKLRADGLVTAIGLGVNEWQVCMEVMENLDLDVILLAGRYTLLEQDALDVFLPACVASGTSVVVGGPYNSGILATGANVSDPHFNYQPASPAVIDRVRSIEGVCATYRVSLAAAALQFPLAHPSVVSVIPGLDTVEKVKASIALYHEVIPAAFWADLKARGLLRPDAPAAEALD